MKDQYEDIDIDDEQYDELDLAERRSLEEKLARRDHELERQRRMPKAFMDDDDEDDVDLTRQVYRQRRNYTGYDEDPDDDMNIMDQELSLETLADIKSSSIADWIALPAVHRTIAREFKNFLLEFIDQTGSSVYGTRIRTLGEINAESLEISYIHLADTKAIIAYFLANAPAEVLKIFDTVAMEAVLLHYQDYERIHAEIHVRIADVPTNFTLRDLRQSHLNALVRVSGVVTRRTGVFPQLNTSSLTALNVAQLWDHFSKKLMWKSKFLIVKIVNLEGPSR